MKKRKMNVKKAHFHRVVYDKFNLPNNNVIRNDILVTLVVCIFFIIKIVMRINKR